MLKHMGTQTINTDRLLLRKFEINDSKDMFENWASDIEVTKFLSWNPHTDMQVTKTLIESWIDEYENKSTYHWVIQLKESEEVIGDITIFNIKDKYSSCEVVYCLSKEFWNKGIMSESLIAVINYLFSEVGLNRIIAMHNSENIASGKVMIKSNMKYEGTLRQSNKLRDIDNFYDLNIYSVLKSDWKS